MAKVGSIGVSGYITQIAIVPVMAVTVNVVSSFL